MTQDFAKKPRSEPPPAPANGNGVRWFFGGFVSGAFVAFLASLWLFVPADSRPTTVDIPKPTVPKDLKVEEMQWDFYEIFPKTEVPVVEEYTDSGDKITVENFRWILQAGSFRDPDDADEQRASLILLGLNVQTQSVKVSGDTWYRVIVGPFDSELERNRAQDKLAQAEIQSMAVKIPKT